jgi:hypothetical protein
MLTLLQMMDYALGQAQLDSSFRADARMWYNIVVNRLTANFDYPFYRTSADTPFVVGQKEYALPADFKTADECYKIDQNGYMGSPIPIIQSYLFNQMDTGNTSGPANVAMIRTMDSQTLNGKIVFNASLASGNGEGFRLFYFKRPAQVATNGANDASVPDFLDQNTIMEELKKEAYEFRNDERYMQKKAEAKESMALFQRNQYNDDAFSTVPLNAQVFRGNNRRTRSRGFGNG